MLVDRLAGLRVGGEDERVDLLGSGRPLVAAEAAAEAATEGELTPEIPEAYRELYDQFLDTEIVIALGVVRSRPGRRGTRCRRSTLCRLG